MDVVNEVGAILLGCGLEDGVGVVPALLVPVVFGTYAVGSDVLRVPDEFALLSGTVGGEACVCVWEVCNT